MCVCVCVWERAGGGGGGGIQREGVSPQKLMRENKLNIIVLARQYNFHTAWPERRD